MKTAKWGFLTKMPFSRKMSVLTLALNKGFKSNNPRGEKFWAMHSQEI